MTVGMFFLFTAFYLLLPTLPQFIKQIGGNEAQVGLATATDLGIGLGAIMLGWVSQQTSYQVLFTVSAVSVAFSLLLFIFFVKRLLKNKSLFSLNAASLPSETS